VVINEVFYHAPDNLNDLQWIEVHNRTDKPVSLAGWKIAKGVKYTFKDSTIAPRGYLVICKNRARFQEFYDTPIDGEFEKSLSRSGDEIELRNSEDTVVDKVVYRDDSPWPRAADGESPSIERISPAAAGDLPENWASSPWSSDGKTPTGTPGAQNHSFSSVLPPVIGNISHTSTRVEPDQPLRIQATVWDSAGLRDVTVRYVVAGPGFVRTEVVLPMVERSRFAESCS